MYGYGYRYNSGLVIGAGGGAPFANTKSLSFDGMDDYLTSANPLTSGSAYTISIFAKLNNIPTLSNLFNINDGVNTIALCYWWNSGNGIIFKSGDGLGYSLTVAHDRALWHSYIFTFDGISTTKIYVDGVSRETTDISLSHVPVNAFEISRGLSGGYQSNMNADEVSVFNRVVTPTELATLSTAPTVDLTDLNPLVWYRNGDNGSWKSPQWLIPSNENKDKVSNYSLDFDGVDDFIDVGSINLGNTFTLSAWVNLNGFANSQNTVFGGGNGIYGIYIPNSTSIYFNFGSGYAIFIVPSLLTSTWYNIVFTRNGANGEVFVNGISQGTTTALGANNFTVNFLGCENQGVFTNYYFNGNLDEASFYDSKLSASDISTLYNGGTPTTLPGGAIAHYKMGEDATFLTNWTVPDNVGSNDGTSANMTIEDRVGEAPNSTSNAVSLNMDEVDRVTDVPI